MHVTDLHVQPVKSRRGVAVDHAAVEPQGLRDDRRWMVVGPDGVTLTAREHPPMLQVDAAPTPKGLLLTATGGDSIQVTRPTTGPSVPVAMSRVGTARDAGEAVARWLTDTLGREVRLVWLDDPTRRPVSAKHGGRQGDVVSFADTGPVLLTARSSLRRLDRWIGERWSQDHAACGAAAGSRPEPLSMRRFRPNVVVDGDVEPFDEDGWALVRIGEVTFRLTEGCDRCSMTLIDPVTGARGKEPLRTLAQHRRRDGVVWFGVRLAPVTAGTVRVGDDVEVLERAVVAG
ncbi:MAG: MOSC domain-containing protein [Cellulomonadaceae bacterium]|nr:MOSC domain-containing protein [Cellulomonadaceae bacterium]